MCGWMKMYSSFEWNFVLMECESVEQCTFDSSNPDQRDEHHTLWSNFKTQRIEEMISFITTPSTIHIKWSLVLKWAFTIWTLSLCELCVQELSFNIKEARTN